MSILPSLSRNQSQGSFDSCGLEAFASAFAFGIIHLYLQVFYGPEIGVMPCHKGWTGGWVGE